MRNYWSRWHDLNAPAPLLVGTVIALLEDGSGASIIELPGGGRLTAVGQTVAVGHMAFVRGGKVEGEAPSLTVVTVTV